MNEYFILLEDCEIREERLNAWERGFIESIRDRLEADKALSEKQIETLEKIWEHATKKG